MSELTVPNFYGPNDQLYFNDINFKFAFSAEGYWDEEMKNDKRYVKWMARHWFTNEAGETKNELLGTHKCTKDDLSDFYPVSKQSQETYDKLISDPKRGLLCLDWSQNLYLQGYYQDARFSTIDILLLPCNYIHTQYGWEGDTISNECIPNLEE